MRRLPEGGPQGERRRRQERRAAHGRGHRAREFAVAKRLRHDGIDRPGPVRIAGRVEIQAGQVVDMQGAHPLASVSEAAAESQPEDGRDQAHGAAILPQNHARAEAHDARAEFLRTPRLRLPGLADFREKSRAGRRTLVDLAFARVAVKSDARRADEHTRARALHALDDAARAEDPALEDPALFFRGPAPENRFAREVDHRVDAGEIWGFFDRKPPRRRVGAARKTKDFVPCRPGGDPVADESRNAGNADFHGVSISSVILRTLSKDL